MKIKLDKAHAAALRADITEVNHLEQIYKIAFETWKARALSSKRYTDAAILDAKQDPEKVSQYSIAPDNASGDAYMELTLEPTPTDQGTKE